MYKGEKQLPGGGGDSYQRPVDEGLKERMPRWILAGINYEEQSIAGMLQPV